MWQALHYLTENPNIDEDEVRIFYLFMYRIFYLFMYNYLKLNVILNIFYTFDMVK